MSAVLVSVAEQTDLQRAFDQRDQVKPQAVSSLPVLQLCGTEAQMGRQHGAMLRELGNWERALDYYPMMPEYMIGSALPPQVMKTFGRLAIDKALVRLERYRHPDFNARTRAFLSALGKPESMAKYFFVMDVLQNLVGTSSKLGLKNMPYRMGATIPPACTSLVSWGDATEDGRLLHARNFDFPGVGVWDSYPTIAFCTPETGLRYGFVATRGGDAVGVSCFNEAGITITTHTRFHQDVVFKGVGILDIVHDMIRNASTINEAIEIARKKPIASSWGLLVSSASESRAVSIETAGHKAHVVEPGKGEDFFACANRYRHPAMIPGEVTISPAFIANSNGRELMARKTGQRGGLTVADLKRFLGSHEDPSDPNHERALGSVVAQPITVQSIVVDPQNQSIHVSIGRAPTGDGPWVEIPWHWEDEPGQRTVDPQEHAQVYSQSRFNEPRAQRGLQAFIEAIRLDQQAGQHDEIVSHIRRAATLDPQESSYHFMAGAFAMQAGNLFEAEAHMERSLENEPSEFYLGQSLLWASRLADAMGQPTQAKDYRKQLINTQTPLLDRHRECAYQESHIPYNPNLFAKMHPVPHLVDGGL